MLLIEVLGNLKSDKTISSKDNFLITRSTLLLSVENCKSSNMSRFSFSIFPIKETIPASMLIDCLSFPAIK